MPMTTRGFKLPTLHKKTKFSIKDFFYKCDQTHIKMRILSHLLRKSLIKKLHFFAQYNLLHVIQLPNPLSYYDSVGSVSPLLAIGSQFKLSCGHWNLWSLRDLKNSARDLRRCEQGVIKKLNWKSKIIETLTLFMVQ